MNGDADCMAGLACNPFAMAQSDLVCVQLCNTTDHKTCPTDPDGGVIQCNILSDQTGALDNGVCGPVPGPA